MPKRASRLEPRESPESGYSRRMKWIKWSQPYAAWIGRQSPAVRQLNPKVDDGRPQILVTCFLALDRLRLRIPGDRALVEIRLIRHVAGQRRVMAKHRVLHYRLSRAHCLEKVPQVRL